MSNIDTEESNLDRRSKWRRMIGFFGPAYLVSVGYMDPGNWATDLAGGSQFGYKLLWVLVVSNFIAIFLQSLSARLGVVRRRDLAQCNRDTYSKPVNFSLYILAEIAIAACDLAEVLGMAIGLQLLFGLPLIWGVLISFADTLLLLWLQKLGMRKTEMFIIGLIAIIGGCFMVELFLAKPDFSEIGMGLIPSIPNNTALYIAIGMIGATVMPHNLYLHSALVQTRKIKREPNIIKRVLKYNLWDSAIALNLALLVNAAILILAAATFHKSGMTGVAELEDAHKLLAPLLGSQWASILFAVALIAAGQSSTVTGTLAGQIVMEGYLNLRISPALRRIITRLLAIVPAVVIILISGEGQVGQLLILSQVILSMQLAFAIIPLIHFVSDKKKMGVFALKTTTKIIAWVIAAFIVALNFKLVYDEIKSWIGNSTNYWIIGLVILGIIGMLYLLFVTIVHPLIHKKDDKIIEIHNPIKMIEDHPIKTFKKIALSVEFSAIDQLVFRYALQFASPNTQFVLIHITESTAPQLMDEIAEDYETIEDQNTLNNYVRLLHEKGFEAIAAQGFRHRNSEIARLTKEHQADLLIMGSHGHKAFADFMFGETVNKVRHLVKIPVFIAK